MSQEDHDKKEATDQKSAPAPRDVMLVKVDQASREVILTDPVGREFAVRLDEETPKPPAPLTVEEFGEAWERLSNLGITWTTDIPPAPRFTEDWKPSATFANEYEQIQKQFPNFPRELGGVILHKLLHKPKEGVTERKSEIISSLLTQEYRSEFFFKYAIKVPYFEDIDWEVVIKAYERGAYSMPKIAYALLVLTLREPVNTSLAVEEAANEFREPEFITVAVNEHLLDNLIAKLTTIKAALEKAQRAADTLTEVEAQEENSNGIGS